MQLVAVLLAATLASTLAASVGVGNQKGDLGGVGGVGDEREISAEEKRFGAKRKTSTNNDLKVGSSSTTAMVPEMKSESILSLLRQFSDCSAYPLKEFTTDLSGCSSVTLQSSSSSTSSSASERLCLAAYVNLKLACDRAPVKKPDGSLADRINAFSMDKKSDVCGELAKTMMDVRDCTAARLDAEACQAYNANVKALESVCGEDCKADSKMCVQVLFMAKARGKADSETGHSDEKSIDVDVPKAANKESKKAPADAEPVQADREDDEKEPAKKNSDAVKKQEKQANVQTENTVSNGTAKNETKDLPQAGSIDVPPSPIDASDAKQDTKHDAKHETNQNAEQQASVDDNAQAPEAVDIKAFKAGGDAGTGDKAEEVVVAAKEVPSGSSEAAEAAKRTTEAAIKADNETVKGSTTSKSANIVPTPTPLSRDVKDDPKASIDDSKKVIANEDIMEKKNDVKEDTKSINEEPKTDIKSENNMGKETDLKEEDVEGVEKPPDDADQEQKDSEDYPDIDSGPVGPRGGGGGNAKLPKEDSPAVVAHPGHAVSDADDDQSSFFSYFVLLCIVALIGYLVFHNKQKIIALLLEGRRTRGPRSSGRRSRSSSTSAQYRKLDTEEGGADSRETIY